jgi:hypothetical protein
MRCFCQHFSFSVIASEAKQSRSHETTGLLRRFAPRKDAQNLTRSIATRPRKFNDAEGNGFPLAEIGA